MCKYAFYLLDLLADSNTKLAPQLYSRLAVDHCEGVIIFSCSNESIKQGDQRKRPNYLHSTRRDKYPARPIKIKAARDKNA